MGVQIQTSGMEWIEKRFCEISELQLMSDFMTIGLVFKEASRN